MDTETKTLGQTFKEAQEEVNNEAQKPEISTGEGEHSQSGDEKPWMSEELDKDEDFKQSVPAGVNKSPAWRKNYWRLREAERKNAEFEGKMKEFEERFTNLSEQPKTLSVEDLQTIAEKEGFTLTKKEAQDIKKSPAKLSDFLGNITDPESKQWFNQYGDVIKEELRQEMKQELEKINPILNNSNMLYTRTLLSDSETKARAKINKLNQDFGLNIDFDKQIDPELIKMIELKKQQGGDLSKVDILSLTDEWLANNGVKFGKQLTEAQYKKLNEEKKKANIESSNSAPSGSQNFEGKSLKEIWDATRSEHGVR